MMTAGVYGPNGAFRVAVAIPPLACGLAALIARDKFDAADKQMGVSAIFMRSRLPITLQRWPSSIIL